MSQVEGQGAGQSYGDAIPGGGWSCRQTYLRNHLSMEAALRLLTHSREGSQKPLRILDIGGGVIEPLLLAALVQGRFPGVPSTIRLVDLSEDVITLIRAARAGSRWEREHQGQTLIGFDPAAGVLPIATLAKVFSSPESPVNPHLAEPASLIVPVAELKRLGALPHMGLPNDVEQAVEALSNATLGVAFGIRELDEVVYVDDKEGEVTRLRIRTDAIFTRVGDSQTDQMLASVLLPLPHGAGLVQAPLGAQVMAIDPNDGLTRPRLAGVGAVDVDVARDHQHRPDPQLDLAGSLRRHGVSSPGRSSA